MSAVVQYYRLTSEALATQGFLKHTVAASLHWSEDRDERSTAVLQADIRPTSEASATQGFLKHTVAALLQSCGAMQQPLRVLTANQNCYISAAAFHCYLILAS